jgi:DNA polymerase III subunit beta
MQLTIPRSELKQAVSGLSRVVSKRTTLPVLAHIRLAVQDGKATATATDLDGVLDYRFQKAQCDGKGVTLLPLAELQLLTKGKDSDTVAIKTSNEALIEVSNTVGGQPVLRRINGIDPKEWPSNKVQVEVGPVDETFLSHVRRAALFASTDETRYILNSVSLEVGESGDYLVATDGRRLTALNTLKSPFKKGCVIPTSKFLTWSKLDPEALLIGYEEPKGVGWFRLVTPEWDYKVRTREGTYPNWRHLVPSEAGKHRLVITNDDAALLAKVLPTFAGHATYNSRITFRGVSGKVQISGRGDDDPAISTMDLPTSGMEGGEADISVNRWYFLDALEAGFRTFAFEDEFNALLSHDSGGGVHVLMPLKMRGPPVPAKNEVPAQAEASTSEPTTEPTTEPTPTNQKEEKRMKKPSESPPANANPMPQPQTTALERVLVAYETAKSKVREANDALASIAVAVKEALREDKQRRAEVESVRAGLARLQSIKV